MFGFDRGVSGVNSSGFKPMIPVFNGKQELFQGGSRNLLFTPDGIVLTRCSKGRMSAST